MLTESKNEKMTVDERHFHFYKYTGGEWDSGNEVFYKFKCECGNISTDLCGAGKEWNLLARLNEHWWQIPDKCPYWKTFGHDFTAENGDLVCINCKYRFKDYEKLPEGYKQRCDESKFEYLEEGQYRSSVHLQCIVAKNHKYNHRFEEKRDR